MKLKKIFIVVFLILIAIFGYQYYRYIKIKKNLMTIYNELPFKYNINHYPSFFIRKHKRLPNRDEFEKYLLSVDSLLFKENNYVLKIDSLNQQVLLYSYYPSNKDVNLSHIINLGTYNPDEKLKFPSFWQYLFTDYNTLFIKNSYIIKQIMIDGSKYKIMNISKYQKKQ